MSDQVYVRTALFRNHRRNLSDNAMRSLHSLALRLVLLGMIAVFGCFATLANAQSAGNASVQGSVSDSTGASVPNAAVVLTNSETGTTRTTVTDSSGLYSLPNVPVGPYALTVTASGFQGYTQKGVL